MMLIHLAGPTFFKTKFDGISESCKTDQIYGLGMGEKDPATNYIRDKKERYGHLKLVAFQAKIAF